MKKISLILVLTLFVGVGLVHAQDSTSTEPDLPNPGILPGHPLYFVKSIGESLGGLFSFGAEAKANHSFGLAERRLAEVNALSNRAEVDQSLVRETVERYQRELERAENRVNEAREAGSDVDDVASRVAEATLKHQSVLAEVYERVPEEAKEAISNAMEVSVRGHEAAVSAVSEEQRGNLNQNISETRDRVSPRLDELRSQGVPVPQVPVSSDDSNGSPSAVNGVEDDVGNGSSGEGAMNRPDEVGRGTTSPLSQ